MARRYRPGDIKWVAYPDGYARVEIVSRGTGGRVFKDGKKPENPYVIEDEEGEEYVLGEDQLHDDPVAASIAVTKMRDELGIEDNPDDEDGYDELLDNPDDEDDEEFEDEDEED